MSDMWEGLEEDFEQGDNDFSNLEKKDITNGTFKAEVDFVFTDEERGAKDVKLYVKQFHNHITKKFWLNNPDPQKRKNSRKYAAVQLAKVGFKDAFSGPGLKAAFDSLKGMEIMIKISDRPNSIYKNVDFVSLAKQDPGAVADLPSFDGDDIHF